MFTLREAESGNEGGHLFIGGGVRPGSSAESALHRDKPEWWREAVSVGRSSCSAESALHRDEPGWWREAVSVKESPVVHSQRSTGINPSGGGRSADAIGSTPPEHRHYLQLTDAPGFGWRLSSSFPSSAWERRVSKLCFEKRRHVSQKTALKKREVELRTVRSQAELGNERRRHQVAIF